MKNKAIRMFTATLAAVLCMAAVSVTAYAGGVDPHPQPLPEETEKPTTGGIEMEPEDVPVTPKGNAALVDDFFGDKQLITVTTKAGNYFYILIDRANEDKETAVHFLNQVDDADLKHCWRTAKPSRNTVPARPSVRPGLSIRIVRCVKTTGTPAPGRSRKHPSRRKPNRRRKSQTAYADL